MSIVLSPRPSKSTRVRFRYVVYDVNSLGGTIYTISAACTGTEFPGTLGTTGRGMLPLDPRWRTCRTPQHNAVMSESPAPVVSRAQSLSFWLFFRQTATKRPTIIGVGLITNELAVRLCLERLFMAP